MMFKGQTTTTNRAFREVASAEEVVAPVATVEQTRARRTWLGNGS